jgi:hypothetical protein
MWAEILNARFKDGWKQSDLDRLMSWNTEYHVQDGIGDVRYFVSEDRTRFVMMVGYRDREEMVRLRAKWDTSGAESQEWFQRLVTPLFAEGQSAIFEEVPGPCARINRSSAQNAESRWKLAGSIG